MKSILQILTRRLVLISVVLFCIFSHIKCDLPVHCKREQIAGEWVFRIENTKFDAKMFDQKTTCGHGFPDKIEQTVGDVDFSFDEFNDVELSLNNDYTITDKSGQKVGSWTTVYDEGFVAYYGKQVFTAFMKYYKKESFSSEYISNCEKTMIGWYQPNSNENNKNWSCFFGFRTSLAENFRKNKVKSFLSNEKQTAPQMTSLLEKSSKVLYKEHNNKELNLNEIRYGDQIEIISELNKLNLPWKAEIHDEFKNYSFFELKDKLGLRRAKSLKTADEYSFKESNQNKMNPFSADFTHNVNNSINTQCNFLL